MAADIRPGLILERSRKRQKLSHAPKLLCNEQVEVRSVEDGLRGSWHRGTVIERRTQIRVVKYAHLLCDNSSENLVEIIPVLFAVDGKIPSDWRPSDFPNYRGKIRPVPPLFLCDEIRLHYRQCVDAFYEDAWWEGVVFDHDDGSEERLIFFPDMGFEIISQLKNLRVTQDWDAASDEWKVRGDWVFLNVIDELKLEKPLLVSVKQIWYEVRMTKSFVKEIKEWTCPLKESWKETVKKVVIDNFNFTMKDFFQRLKLFENLKHKGFKKRFLDSHDDLDSNSTPSDHKTQDLPSEDQWTKPDVLPQPEYCPDAILEYYKYFKSGKKPPVSTTLKVRQHISYLGWGIECKIYNVNAKGKTCYRYRYTDPNGKQYFSLHILCTELKETSSKVESLESLMLSSSSHTKQEPQTEDFETHMAESEYNPQSVVDYYKLASGAKFDLRKMTKSWFKNLQTSARKHLFASGWSNSYFENISGRQVLVYNSPDGKKFYGLREACCHYIQESCSFEFHNPSMKNAQKDLIKKDNGVLKIESLVKKDESLVKEDESLVRKDEFLVKKDESLTTTRVLRSSKRARKDVCSMYQTPRTVLSWLIENNVILPRAKVWYICKKNGCTMKEGRITRDGIKCSCCHYTFSLAKFQSHGGSGYGRASGNIFLEDGRSLLDCQLELKLDLNEKMGVKRNRNEIENENDYICSVCQYGGELVLCDQCPSSFHTSCVGLKEVPAGEWFCPSCCCRICNQNRFEEKYEQSTDGNIQSCEQCEKKCHVGCLKRRGLWKLEAYLEAHWFCSSRCKEIYTGLESLLGKSIPVGKDNLTWTLRKHKTSECPNHVASDMEDELTENYSKLNVAISVMHECFEPVKDSRTGRDIVEDVIFCKRSELHRLNFKGFYTVLLEKDDELITVATVRVYGEKVAEVPLVGTRFQYRRRGMCHILMHELEKRLAKLGVERLVLPAVSSVLHTWTRSFGFSVMTESEKLKFLGCTFLDFQGTTMCQKLLVAEAEAERFKENRTVQQCSSENNGSTTTLEILMNQETHIEDQSTTNLQEASNSNPQQGNDKANTVFSMCYQRRQFSKSKCLKICN